MARSRPFQRLDAGKRHSVRAFMPDAAGVGRGAENTLSTRLFAGR